MQRLIQGFIALTLIILSLLAWLDGFVWQQSAQAIYAGEHFLYPSHVNLFARAPLALVMLGFVAIWLFMRHIIPTLNHIRWWAILLLIQACAVFSLIAPLAQLNESAHHLQSIRHEGQMYHLYTQTIGIGDTTCDIVLVQCDALGLQCQHIDHWLISPVCLGEYTPARLTIVDDTLTLRTQDEILYTQVSR